MRMDMFSMQFLWALGAIVLIDLVLAGDNAIVIALAARKLPPSLQRKAILWGTVGAIAVRSAMTVAVVWLLKVPGLLLLGGALLLWIAVKLLKPAGGDDEGAHAAADGFWGAMKTIVIADAVMGLDNVLAVAGAAHGSFLLVVLGLLISIPIVVWGSTLILKWVERFPVIIYAGAAVLAWTAVKMMLGEPLVKAWVDPWRGWSWLACVAGIGGVIAVGLVVNRRNAKETVMNVNAVNADAVAGVAEAEAIAAHGVINVLLPVSEGEESRIAAERLAREMSGRRDVRVHLLHVVPSFHRHIGRFLPPGARRRYVEERADRVIGHLRRLFEVAGVEARVSVASGRDIADRILAVAERESCARIVIGATRKSALVRALTHSVSGRVLEHARVPVEVVAGSDASLWERLGVPAGVGLALAALVIELD
jgi:YjbE family integral membrane protein